MNPEKRDEYAGMAVVVGVPIAIAALAIAVVVMLVRCSA